MLFLPGVIRFSTLLPSPFLRRLAAAPALALLFGLCLFSWPREGAAQTENATAAEENPAAATALNEEIIEFEEDSPDLVGHRLEEKTSYADYETQMKNANAAKGTEATGDDGAASSREDASAFTPTTPPSTEQGRLTPAAANATLTGFVNPPPPPLKVVPPPGEPPTAMRLFRFIPPSIFDNTIEGMREDEKQLLMDSGENEFWVLTALTENELVIDNKAPEIDTQATLILFHADNGDIVMAMGVSAGDSCALELWRYLAGKRGITPMPMPDEPAVSEFFETNRALPEDTDVSMLICLDPVERTLIAKPLLWTPSGLDQIVLDTRVIYNWDGNKFVKKVIPIERALPDQAHPAAPLNPASLSVPANATSQTNQAAPLNPANATSPISPAVLTNGP